MKLIRVSFVTITLLTITSISLYYYCSQSLVLKSNDETFIYYPFTDKNDYKVTDGTSELHNFKKYEDGSLLFSYTLNDGTQFPFAGITIYKKDKSYIDLSKYSVVKIKLGSGNLNNLLILIKTFIPGYSQEHQEYSWRYNQSELFKESDEREMKIKLNDLKTPMWWYQDHGIFPKQIPKEINWEMVKTLSIESSSLIPKNKKHDLIINEIRFERFWWPFYLSIVLLALVISFLLFCYLSLKKRVVDTSKILYSKLNVLNESEEKFERIVKSVGENYSNIDFSLIKLSEETGISQRSIGLIIKKNTNGNFKRYLNNVRLKEAERLILNTDRSITEIAYLVGYNYPSHFNRLFVNEFKKTPTELRKEMSKTSKIA